LISEVLPEGQEGLVYADLDLGMISLAKAAADPAGHYSRPDVTRLLLDKTPGDRVVMRQRAAGEVTGGEPAEPAQRDAEATVVSMRRAAALG
jgi:nitrilase